MLGWRQEYQTRHMRLHHHGGMSSLGYGTEVEIVECEAQADGRYHVQVSC
jgi:Lon protease-like protein